VPDLLGDIDATSSSSAIGPMGNPKASIASSMASIGTPSLRMKAASFIRGPRMRLV